jgi:hypothetical protein
MGLSELYSTDSNKIKYINQQIGVISNINGWLFLIYYLVLCIYIYKIFRTIVYGSNRIPVILLIILLLIYPFFIYDLEQQIYDWGEYIFKYINYI